LECGHKPLTGRALSRDPGTNKGFLMLYTLAIVLVVLWLLGMVSAYTIGGFIHILLVVAVIIILVRLISGRKVL
jgi:hypothetical protein